jgi:metal-responsive CopG/Arc/MetJ family transcriptional regulator
VRAGGGRKPTGRKVKTSAFALPPELVEALDAAAAERGVSKSKLVADALRAYLAVPDSTSEEA